MFESITMTSFDDLVAGNKLETEEEKGEVTIIDSLVNSKIVCVEDLFESLQSNIE